MAENEKDIELEEDKKTEENAEEVTEAEKTEQKPDNKTEEADKKNSKKKDKKDKKDQQIEELTDKYRRTMAEFDNFRKRTEKEKASMYEIGARDIIEKILPVVDNFERGLNSIPEDEKTGAVAEGIRYISSLPRCLKMQESRRLKPAEPNLTRISIMP